MRAMAFAAYGRPLEEIELPEPELAPGSALLEVLTCGVCFSDVKTWTGQMPFSGELPLPHVPGHEVAARVVATDPPAPEEVRRTVSKMLARIEREGIDAVREYSVPSTTGIRPPSASARRRSARPPTRCRQSSAASSPSPRSSFAASPSTSGRR